MSKLLQEITDNYLDDRWENEKLRSTLCDLDEIQLQVVFARIKEVEEKYGECKLLRVTFDSSSMSVATDHPDDPSVSFDRSTYRRY